MNLSDSLAELYELERDMRAASIVMDKELSARFLRRCYALNVAIGYIEAVTDIPSNVNKKVAIEKHVDGSPGKFLCEPSSKSNVVATVAKPDQLPGHSVPVINLPQED